MSGRPSSRHGNRRTGTSDRVVILSLFALLTFFPCKGFLPIYVSRIRFGWTGFALLTIILSTARDRHAGFHLARIDRNWQRSAALFGRYESLVMGSLLLLVAVLVTFLEQ